MDTTRPTTSRPTTRPTSPKGEAEYADPRFAEFWGIYPKRVAKRKAWLEWKAALKRGADPAEIILGAKHYAAVRDGEDPQYTKQPDGWLKADRWTDEATPAARTSGNGSHVPYQDPADQSAYLQELFPLDE